MTPAQRATPEQTTTSKMEVESEGAVKREKVSVKKRADIKKQKGLEVQIKTDNGETAAVGTKPGTEDGAHSSKEEVKIHSLQDLRLKQRDPDLNRMELLFTNPTPGSEGGAQRSPEDGRGM